MMKITELPYKIEVGTTFEHTMNGKTYRYRVVKIETGSEKCNDKISLFDLDEISFIDVDPEWFNQRKIKITTTVNLTIFFPKNEKAYWNEIPIQSAEKLINDFKKHTEYYIVEVVT